MIKRYLLVLATCILLAYCFVISHENQITVALANFYFKQNRMEKALVLSEKAFNSGVNDINLRDTYVNALINSPLSIKAQERLEKFISYPVDDGAKLRAEYFLHDLKIDINEQYPDNYIMNAATNQQIVAWSNSDITYSFEKSADVPDYYLAEIENAFAEIEKAMEHRLLFTNESQNTNILIKFQQESLDSAESKYIVAYTNPVYSLNKLKNMVITFHIKNHNGENYTQNQIYNTALHEIVHALGFMGHCSNRNNLMYMSKDTLDFLKDERVELNFADINTLKLLYKIKPDITNDVKDGNSIKYDYTPRIVLGDDYSINKVKRKEAKNYIKKAPEISNGYIDLAESFIADENYEKAIKYLEKALTMVNSDELKCMLYYNLALAHFYQNDIKEAKIYLNKSSEIKDFEEIHYLSAEIYLKEGNTANAVKEYEKLIAMSPKNIEYTIALTNIYVTQKKYFKARKVLKNYFQHNPSDKNNPRLSPYGIIKLFL